MRQKSNKATTSDSRNPWVCRGTTATRAASSKGWGVSPEKNCKNGETAIFAKINSFVETKIASKKHHLFLMEKYHPITYLWSAITRRATIQDISVLSQQRMSMPNLYHYFSIILLLILSFAPCQAQEADGFYEKGREGFYWYEKKLSIEEEKAFEQPPTDPYTYSELWLIHPEKLQHILKNRMNLAIQAPTEENVYRYIQIQDVAKRKSMAFAGVMGMVSQTHPEFSGNNLTGMTLAGKQTYLRNKGKHRKELLSTGSQDYALIVFESDGCGYCDAQRPIIEAFQDNHGWAVKYVDIYEHANLADKYSIDMTPAIMMLCKASQKIIHISKGVVSLAELQNRIAQAIRYISGESEPERWFSGHGVMDPLKFVDRRTGGK